MKPTAQKAQPNTANQGDQRSLRRQDEPYNAKVLAEFFHNMRVSDITESMNRK